MTRSRSIYQQATLKLGKDPLKPIFEQNEEIIINNSKLADQIQKIMVNKKLKQKYFYVQYFFLIKFLICLKEMGLLKQKTERYKVYTDNRSIVKTDCLMRSNKSQARGLGGSIYTG